MAESDTDLHLVKPATVAYIRSDGKEFNYGGRITKSDQTKKSYIRRCETLYASYANECLTENPPLADFISWIVQKFPTLRPASVRNYRASLSFYIQHQFEQGIIPQEDRDFLLGSITKTRGITYDRRLERRTSAKKALYVDKDNIKKILIRLKDSRSRYAPVAASIFMGSLLTGLRPSEWEHAKLIDNPDDPSTALLIIKNAKASNGRSFGEERVLIIPEKHVLSIRKTIDIIKSFLEHTTWQKMYSQARKVLSRTEIKQDGKNVSMYTARHQFIANMKNVYSREDVALLVGHGTTETASKHYGKMRSGHQEYKQARKNLIRLRQEAAARDDKDKEANPNEQ